MKAKSKQFIARDVRAARSNRATRRVKASPSILERPLNPVSLELVRFRKRLFMSRAAFAARIGMRLADLRALELGNNNHELLAETIESIHALGQLFNVSSMALRRAIKLQGLPGIILDVIVVNDCHAQGELDSLKLQGALERLFEKSPTNDLAVPSQDALISILLDLKTWGYVAFAEATNRWTGKKLLRNILATTQGHMMESHAA